MVELLVVDTGPLVAIERMGCLDIVGRLPYELVCPEAVRQELDEGERCGHARIAPPWLAARALASALAPLGLVELGPGEAAVIQLARELGAATVVIDEWKGRRAALALGLEVTGSLGLLATAKQRGLIESLRPLVEHARRHGIRYHPAVVAAVLREVGEDPPETG
ncbi:MAG: DUF3368 domain-containing protein [Deltaproteobacteria bacterium]|nr:DUF3368 domain-containing protein [Deltaproteobacteria bacterium]